MQRNKNYKTILKRTLIVLLVCVLLLSSAILGIINTKTFTAKAEADLEINTLAELETFRDEVNGGNDYADKTIVLNADITLSANWVPIGTNAKPFEGTFDGNGKTITISSINTSGTEIALFGVIDGTIKSLTVAGTIVAGDQDNKIVAGIVAQAGGESLITNCVNNAAITYTGVSDGYSTSTLAATGGIVGICGWATYIENCTNNGNINGIEHVGGIVGDASASSVAYCTNNGNITAGVSGKTAQYTGGIGGDINSVVLNCANFGNVTSNGDIVGGIVGELSGEAINCLNGETTTITGNNKVGGIAGAIDNNTGGPSVSYSVNCSTNISATTGPLVGSLVGRGVRNAEDKVATRETFYIKTDGLIGVGDFDNDEDGGIKTFEKNTTSPIITGTTDKLIDALNDSVFSRRDAYVYNKNPGPPTKVYKLLWKLAESAQKDGDTPYLYPAFDSQLFFVEYEPNFGSFTDNMKYQTVASGATYTLPTPTRNAYTFVGWYLDESLTIEHNKVDGVYTDTFKVADQRANAFVSHDLNVYAKWTATPVVPVTITLNLNGGTITGGTTITGNVGGTLTIPTPTKTGYTFDGWYTDSQLTQKFTATTFPASDTQLYAKWNSDPTPVVPVTITLNLDGGTITGSNPITGNVGDALTIPTPTKTGFTFAGWYTDSDLEHEFAATTFPASDTQLYAKWTANGEGGNLLWLWILLGVIGAGGIGGGLWFFLVYKKKKDEEDESQNNVDVDTNSDDETNNKE